MISGKEKDVETAMNINFEGNLANHGVRKSRYEIGIFVTLRYEDYTGWNEVEIPTFLDRFTTPEPLWEKYYSWSPYVYSMNNPINAKDADGKDIIVLIDKEGAFGTGHMAVLIGNETDGWYLYSKNGGISGISGKSDDPDVGVYFETLDKFIKSDNKYADVKRYDSGYRITSDKDKDIDMKKEMANQVTSPYLLAVEDCATSTGSALKIGGFDEGNMISYPFFGLFTLINPPHPKPNVRFKYIQKNNVGTKIDLREKKEEERK